MYKTTNINNIKTTNNFEEKEEKIDDNDLSTYILDLSLSLQKRITLLNLYYQKVNNDGMIDLINKLSMMYQLSGTKLLKEYLFSICNDSQISPFLKSIAAKGLWIFDEKDNIGYEAINLVIPKLDRKDGTPYRIEFIKILMINDKYKEQASSYFCNIINDTSIECDYRYKSILNLDKQFIYFIHKACLTFLYNNTNKISYRILTCQYLLQSCPISSEEKIYIENTLLSFAKNKDNEYNIRADSADVLLQLGSEDIKNIAKDIIMNLGKIDNKNITIYDNAQNIHTNEIEKSVKEALEFLQKFNVMKQDEKQINLDYVETQIMNMVNNYSEEDINKIKVSFNRICMDRLLYSTFNCTLSNILLKIWSYIIGNKHEEEMKKRLIEELIDMSGTCSSGYVTRLINVISGFGDFSIRISWREQIIANFNGRLNARIKLIEDIDFKNKVLNEMTISTEDNHNRLNVSKFLRENISILREELYNEFKTFIDDTDFDLYFRYAISHYQTGEFI